MKTAILSLLLSLSAAAIDYPGPPPGAATVQAEAADFVLANALLSARFVPQANSLKLAGVTRTGGGALAGEADLFRIVFTGGTTLGSSAMSLALPPQMVPLAAAPDSPHAAERVPGQAVRAIFQNANASLRVRWQAELRDGSGYLRQTLEFTALTGSFSVKEIVGLTGKLDGAAVSGYTDGSVFTGDGFFAGLESPLAKTTVEFIDPAATVAVGNWTPATVAPGRIDYPVSFPFPGPWKVTFTYTSGNHRLNVDKVELLDGANAVVATDEHFGYAGVPSLNNTYTLQVPAAGSYTIGVENSYPASETNSNGTVTAKLDFTPAIGNWTPALVAPKRMTFPVTIPAAGEWEIKFTYTSGNHRLNVDRVELLDGANAVVAADEHFGYAGSPSSANTYTLQVPAAGTYTLGIDNDYPVGETNSNGAITLAPRGETSLRATWPRNLTLAPGTIWKTSSVIGIHEPGQLRRSFLHYLERERAHPYRQFVHYNSWYDLNIGRNDNPNPFLRMTEAQTLAVVDAWNTQLYTQRGVRLDGFVWDDGWDAFNSLWGFHVGFPNGFTETDRRSRNQQAGTGAWLSPWGGYGSSKSQRVASWNSTHNPDISEFHLSNNEYYEAFRGRCQQMLADYDMRYFKFDGIGAGTLATGPAPGNEADIDGLQRLHRELRDTRADVFINSTVGTWASPFWMLTSDSIWRQGEDAGLSGTGNNRERWITYRDNMVFDRFASNAPLFPLNSLMFHGLIVGNYPGTIPAQMPLDLQSVKNEIRCAMGCGSGLQELYVTHGLMTAAMWDELANGIRWLRANADTLADVHWVGGNPESGGTLTPYGWAAWSPRKGTLTLRNPSGTARDMTLTLAAALELPAGAATSFTVRPGYADQRALAGITNASVATSDSLVFSLQPYEVLVFDLWPQGATIPAAPLSAAAATPGTFGAWAAAHGVSIPTETGLQGAFSADHDGNGIPNGVEYAYGDTAPLAMKWDGSEPVAEWTRQLPATLDSVESGIRASTDLTSWNLTPAPRAGAPAGAGWWTVPGEPKAFFRVEAKLR